MVGTTQGLSHQFSRHDLLFSPDHQVFESRVDPVVTVQAMMNDFDVVHQTNEHIGSELVELVKVKGAEQAVAPPEGGMRIHDDVRFAACVGDDVLEHSAAKGVQPAQWQIENAAWVDIWSLGIHLVTDVVQVDALAVCSCQTNHRLKVVLFVHAHLAGDDRTHERVYLALLTMIGYDRDYR